MLCAVTHAAPAPSHHDRSAAPPDVLNRRIGEDFQHGRRALAPHGQQARRSGHDLRAVGCQVPLSKVRLEHALFLAIHTGMPAQQRQIMYTIFACFMVFSLV